MIFTPLCSLPIIVDFDSDLNVIPFEMLEKLGLHFSLSITSLQRSKGIVEDSLVHMGNFSIPTDFVVLDMEIKEYILS